MEILFIAFLSWKYFSRVAKGNIVIKKINEKNCFVGYSEYSPHFQRGNLNNFPNL